MIVDKNEYVQSHGKNPRGKGYWAFKISEQTFWFPCFPDNTKMDSLSNAILYSEAVQLASKKAKELNVKKIKVLS